MKRIILSVFCVVFIMSGMLTAAPFGPVFHVGQHHGKLLVQGPAGGDFVQAEAEKAYAYGSIVKTDGKGSGVIILSEGNEIDMMANTAFALGQLPGAQPNMRTLGLDYGRVDVTLEENFTEANSFQVMTIVAVCDAMGGKFKADVQSENDMDVATFSVETGKLKVSGPNFAVPMLDSGDILTVSTAKDKSYTLLETVEGEFDVEIKDPDGNPKLISTTKGSIVKIWRRLSESGKTLIVNILITAADGTVGEAITYTEDLPETPGEPGEEIPVPDQVTTTTQPDGLLLLTTTPTTTTTTSTTFPSPTPVGLR